MRILRSILIITATALLYLMSVPVIIIFILTLTLTNVGGKFLAKLLPERALLKLVKATLVVFLWMDRLFGFLLYKIERMGRNHNEGPNEHDKSKKRKRGRRKSKQRNRKHR